MWRSIFLAIGITLCIVGAECTVVDEAVVAKPVISRVLSSDASTVYPNPVEMKEWMPWSFLSAGVVIILYTITLPKRFNQG